MKKSYKSLIFSLGFKANLHSKLGMFVFSTMLLSSVSIFAQTPQQKAVITQNSNVRALNELQAETQKKAISDKKAAIEAAKRNGWEIKTTLKNGSFAELQRLAPDGSPIYFVTYNEDAARSTRTNHLNSGGSLGLNLDGQGMTGHVWDGGHARVTHQEYDGAGGNNRVTIMDTASEGGTQLNFHAAHVTGTITASGVQAAAKGMAPQSKVNGYMWNNDVAEATTAAANGMIVSNHSYGFRSDLVPDQYFGAYIDESRNWDEVMFNAPFYLMVVAAGNDGNQNSVNGQPLDGNSSYDKLTGHSTSKNNLVVANAQDANIASDGTLNSVSINSSSSEGPTDDYRIKPDITGNGTGVYSTYQNSDTAYNSITGTSMASPNVAGSLLLLQQHYNNTNGSLMRAATLKGLALHTADDAGPSGPDAVYGWGLLNAKRAAETITNAGNETKVEELTLSWNASTDNVGVTEYDVYQGSSVIGSTANTTANVTGLTADTAYAFSVVAKDAAGNESAASNTVNVTTAGGSTGGGCTSGISSFPYSEGFENTIGDWTQSSADDFNWTVDANGTPSRNTGPSSADQGTYYIFVEASGNGTGFPNKQAIITSPCFDLSGLTEASFSFAYHMYGFF